MLSLEIVINIIKGERRGKDIYSNTKYGGMRAVSVEVTYTAHANSEAVTIFNTRAT